jgi:hypothetical protein
MYVLYIYYYCMYNCRDLYLFLCGGIRLNSSQIMYIVQIHRLHKVCDFFGIGEGLSIDEIKQVG